MTTRAMRVAILTWSLAALSSCKARPAPSVDYVPPRVQDAPEYTGPGISDLSTTITIDPDSCEAANATKSYVGCEYWPTITANVVLPRFDFAVVVANAGRKAADIQLTGPNFHSEATVEPNQTWTMKLPWNDALKGPDACSDSGLTRSVRAEGAAFHLVSSAPVIVYQFNPLQYSQGTCAIDPNESCPAKQGCYSYSNDASLLLPTAGLTSTYRITGIHGWTAPGPPLTPLLGPTLTLTAVHDNTEVSIELTSKAVVLKGDGLRYRGNNRLEFTLDHAGDVIELAGQPGDGVDYSGSVVRASQPVQVISGIGCIDIPSDRVACDHVEETVHPAETLGKHYLVTAPTPPSPRTSSEHLVRFVGNEDDTTLHYYPDVPSGCPTTLQAAEVGECLVNKSMFEVWSDREFAVSSFMVGYGPGAPGAPARGDPSATVFASVEQYRTSYVFLAPPDFTESVVDITGTADAAPVVDGVLATEFTPLGKSVFGVYRVRLTPSGFAHTIAAQRPVGVQLLGYGDYTSYQVPAGLDLKLIAPDPPPVR